MRTVAFGGRWVGATVVASGLLGCGDPAHDPGPPPRAAASVDLGRYCHASCERAAKCGLESLDKSAKGTPVEMPVLNEARGSLSETVAACEATCNAGEPAGERASAALHEAERCLDQTECEPFAACLGRVKL